MKRFIFITCIFSSISWGGADWVGNGASLSENRILMAFGNIENYIEATLKDPTLNIDRDQFDILSKMLETIPHEKRMNPNMIQFSNESERFFIDGQVKVAFTGLSLGSTILINKKLLSYQNNEHQYEEISLLQALSLLVHEFGHHQGITDHTFLDQLGALVANRTRFEEKWFILSPERASLGAQLFSPAKELKTSSALYLVNLNWYMDITEKILSLHLCENYNLGIELRALQVWNIYWEKPFGLRPKLRAYLSFECRWPNEEWKLRVGDQLEIQTEIDESISFPAFKTNNVLLNIYRCERDNEICRKNREFYFKNKNQNNKNFFYKEEK